MTDFKHYGVTSELVQSLKTLGITVPTPVQALAIPKALEGRDILASAQTGTGKTIAYLIPILQGLAQSETSTALILVPTRELANQVKNTIVDVLGKGSSLRTATLIGGEPMAKQFYQLKNQPSLIIGTPGRVSDHLQRGSLKLNDVAYLVLDETDRMLDIGFTEQLEKIVKHLPKERQTFMFSATFPENIMKISQKYLTDPERISVGGENKPIAKIKQEMIRTTSQEKFELLLEELAKRAGSIIVFVKTKIGADKLARLLYAQNHSVDALHGDLRQRTRDRVIQSFRNLKYRILIATDVAARGLDVPHIQHVINYDLPDSPDDYVHRIGRTGRAGAEGQAMSFVSPDQNHKWKAINKALNIDDSEPEDQPRGRRAPRDDNGRDRSPRDSRGRGDGRDSRGSRGDNTNSRRGSRR